MILQSIWSDSQGCAGLDARRGRGGDARGHADSSTTWTHKGSADQGVLWRRLEGYGVSHGLEVGHGCEFVVVDACGAGDASEKKYETCSTLCRGCDAGVDSGGTTPDPKWRGTYAECTPVLRRPDTPARGDIVRTHVFQPIRRRRRRASKYPGQGRRSGPRLPPVDANSLGRRSEHRHDF